MNRSPVRLQVAAAFYNGGYNARSIVTVGSVVDTVIVVAVVGTVVVGTVVAGTVVVGTVVLVALGCMVLMVLMVLMDIGGAQVRTVNGKTVVLDLQVVFPRPAKMVSSF